MAVSRGGAEGECDYLRSGLLTRSRQPGTLCRLGCPFLICWMELPRLSHLGERKLAAEYNGELGAVTGAILKWEVDKESCTRRVSSLHNH